MRSTDLIRVQSLVCLFVLKWRAAVASCPARLFDDPSGTPACLGPRPQPLSQTRFRTSAPACPARASRQAPPRGAIKFGDDTRAAQADDTRW